MKNFVHQILRNNSHHPMLVELECFNIIIIIIIFTAKPIAPIG